MVITQSQYVVEVVKDYKNLSIPKTDYRFIICNYEVRLNFFSKNKSRKVQIKTDGEIMIFKRNLF